MTTISLRDRFHMLTAVAFLLLGAVILFRAAAAHVWAACPFGAVMLAFGAYRCRIILRALREGKR